MLYIKRVGIVGAGAMGSQIAEIMALNGYEVFLKDVSKEFVDRGINNVRKDLEGLVRFHETKAEREISRIEEQDGVTLSEEQKKRIHGKLKPTYDGKRASDALSRIHGSESFDPFKEVDLVVEAIVEEVEEKKKLFKELDQIIPKKVVLASNTSTLSITEIASAARGRSDKIIGTHFFNPPVTLPVIEVIPGLETSEDTTADIIDFLSALRNHRYPMMPVRVKEVPGFLVNRILGAMLNEAFALYEEGVASMRDIDQAMKTGAGLPMGPFELSDLIGLDVLYHENGGRVSHATPDSDCQENVLFWKIRAKVGQRFLQLLLTASLKFQRA